MIAPRVSRLSSSERPSGFSDDGDRIVIARVRGDGRLLVRSSKRTRMFEQD